MQEESSMDEIIKNLLKYSFEQINWNFDHLTDREKSIIGTEENLNKLKDFSESKITAEELLK